MREASITAAARGTSPARSRSRCGCQGHLQKATPDCPQRKSADEHAVECRRTAPPLCQASPCASCRARSMDTEKPAHRKHQQTESTSNLAFCQGLSRGDSSAIVGSLTGSAFLALPRETHVQHQCAASVAENDDNCSDQPYTYGFKRWCVPAQSAGRERRRARHSTASGAADQSQRMPAHSSPRES